MKMNYDGGNYPPYNWTKLLEEFNKDPMFKDQPVTTDTLNRYVKSRLLEELASNTYKHPAVVSPWTGASEFHKAFPSFGNFNQEFIDQNHRLHNAITDEALNHENPVFYAPKVNEAPVYVQEAELPERRLVKNYLLRNTSTYY